MQALGIPTTRKQIVEFMELADKDGSGTIEPEEFKRLMAGMIKNRPVDKELDKAFKMYDEDDTGFINRQNLKKVALEMMEEANAAGDRSFKTVKDSEITWMLKIADRKQDKHDGLQVDREDFMHVMFMAGLMGEKKEGEDSIQKQNTPFADDRLNQLIDQAQNFRKFSYLA